MNGGKGAVTTSPAGEVEAFLDRVRSLSPRPAAHRGRLIFALDATASRQPHWDQAMSRQAAMFSAAAGLGGLEVQLVWYRGFGECRASPWVSDAPSLLARMTAVSCLGGQTQIGRVLNHVLKETAQRQVAAVVFVGDACEEDADTLCHRAGTLGLHGVPLFLFQDGSDSQARDLFQQMAKLSGGAWCPLDDDSARHLADLLSAVAVFAAGGRRALSDWSRGRSGPVLRLTQQLSPAPPSPAPPSPDGSGA
jgi:hypothetical protein